MLLLFTYNFGLVNHVLCQAIPTYWAFVSLAAVACASVVCCSVLVSMFSKYGVVVSTNEAMDVLHAAIANSDSMSVK